MQGSSNDVLVLVTDQVGLGRGASDALRFATSAPLPKPTWSETVVTIDPGFLSWTRPKSGKCNRMTQSLPRQCDRPHPDQAALGIETRNGNLFHVKHFNIWRQHCQFIGGMLAFHGQPDTLVRQGLP